MKTKVNVLSIERPYGLLLMLLVAAMILAACSPTAGANQAPAITSAPNSAASQPPASTKAPAQPPAATSAPGTPSSQLLGTSGEASIKVAADPKLGNILVDDKGMTLYMFKVDDPDKSKCDAECLVKWPPLVTKGSPSLGTGVDSTLVGSTKTTDGRTMVTYNHMPLYYWYKDMKPGDTNGQGVGDVWYVVSPAGEVITTDITSSPTTAPAASGSGTSINVATSPTLGSFLTDGKGMTLYMFTKDSADKSNCDASCLANWPPFIAEGTPTLGQGLDKSMVGSTTTTDGRTIVTYNHMPLYYFIKDNKAGDTNGQGVGNVWYVVAPDGTVIKK